MIMKKVCLIIFALLGITTIHAQYQVNSFFDDKGNVRLETQELSEAADTLVSIFHRADDVVGMVTRGIPRCRCAFQTKLSVV